MNQTMIVDSCIIFIMWYNREMNKKHNFQAFLIITSLVFSNVAAYAYDPERSFDSTPVADKIENIEPVISIPTVPSIDEFTKSKSIKDITPIKLPVVDDSSSTSPFISLKNRNFNISPSLVPTNKIRKILPPIDDENLRKETETILKYGMNNSTNVQIIQNELIKQGYYNGNAHGNYDKLTVISVANFQRDNNIIGDGMIIGTLTLGVLKITLGEDREVSKLTFEEQILFMGGYKPNANVGVNDVWSSTNIHKWNLVSPNDPTSTTKWEPAGYFETAYYDNKYWVFGRSGVIDLWSSPDGENWTRTSNDLPGGGEFKIVVFNNKILMFRYHDSGPPYSIKVWSSTDGTNWTYISTTPLSLGVRASHEIVVHNEQIYIIGGYDFPCCDGQLRRDVWASPDGVTWNLVTSNGPSEHSGKAISYNGKIYYFGGRDTVPGLGGRNSKVWSTSDGINWTQAMATPSSGELFSEKDDIIVSGGKLWLISQYKGDLWSSTNGINWTKSCTVLPWDFRQGHQMISNGGTPSPTNSDPCNTTPGITVTYPNGGEVFTEGQKIDVTWTSSNIPPDDKIQVDLIIADQNNVVLGDIPLTVSSTNDGKEAITLPTITKIKQAGFPSVVAGKHFKIRIGDEIISPNISDSSDAFFTINELILPSTSCDSYKYLTQWGVKGSENGQLLYPNGIAIDQLGNMYVADSNNHRVQKFNSDGKYITHLGIPDFVNSQLRYPRGVATDLSGNVYVADQFNFQIQKLTSDLKYITKWSTPFGSFLHSPDAVATDLFGNIYVVDNSNHRIQKFTSDGKYVTYWEVYDGSSQVTTPHGVATDPSGNVYITNFGLIQKFTSDGKYIMDWKMKDYENGQFYNPNSIATDSFGNVYVGGGNRIHKFTSDGKYITGWGTSGIGNGQFDFPSGISVDSFGNVYVSDNGNHRIQKFGCATPLSNPKVTVVSPNGEEVFIPGQTIEVNWKTENLLPTAKMSIVLEDVYNNSYTSFDVLTDNDGGHEFTLPSVATYPGLKYGKNFKLRISVEPHIGTGNRITDTSDTTFTIQDTTSTNCSIEIFSVDPSILEVGQSYTINWKTVGCPFVNFQWLFPNGGVAESGITNNSTGSTTMIATEDMIGVTNLTLIASPFVGGGYGKQKTISLTVIPAKVTCNINSFVVPTSTTIASGLSTTVSWSSNCKNVVLQANSGSSTKRYVGGASGTYTFFIPSQPGLIFSTKDKTVDITMIAGSDYDVVSQTKSVIISDVTSPTSNQCAFSSVTATPNPVPTGSSEVTLSWVAPTGCIVYVQAWAPTEGVPKVTSIFKPNTLSFNATDSVKTTISKSSSFYISAQAGSIIGTTSNTSVLSARTIDVKKK